MSMRQAGKRIPAEIVGYDQETGFGLVRASRALDVAPLPLGHSSEVAIGDPLLVLSRDGYARGRCRRSSPAGASSPATGNICCPTPCSPPRRTPTSPAPR